ncbi:anti-sigma factor [Paenibacillus vini]|uniref:Anti-sigma K factor RskA C-terminal domain-containing protein n=1 Tax=Paenibacillus vini TaxID=1476024 RepID=A0ABQ4MFS9_9BACL|nr:anti-sigma factor [Paenibacillus vini]GIP54854.1 hypothetical protein J42TS3_38890 [Paenibacillus vini]
MDRMVQYNFMTTGENRSGSSCLKSFSEEEWIDWLMGLGGEARRAEMEAHLSACPCCREICEAWEPLVSPDTTTDLSNGPDSCTNVLLSESLHRRLRRRVYLTRIRSAAKNLLAVRFKGGALLTGAFILLIFVGWIFRTGLHNDESWGNYVERYEPSAISVMQRPDSISYPMDWGRPEPEAGVVWYNENSREMLMLVGGLVPAEDQVLHVWAVKAGSRDSLGLLQYHAYRAHLYVKDRDVLDEADNIELTIESKDGGPSTRLQQVMFSVDLNGRELE